jgi:hypothetical protein
MNFMGRWVPMVLMDSIILLWLITCVIAVAAICWFRRPRPAAKTAQDAVGVVPRGKQSKRKKRCAAPAPPK